MTHFTAVASPWAWHVHPDVWLLVAVIGGGYFCAVRWLGPRYAPAGGPAVTRRQVTLFGLGLLALWAHSDWPVHDLGERYLFSIHMFQHIGFTLIAAPLLLLGTPQWLMERILGAGRFRAVFARLTRPLAAGVIFNLVTVLAHWPVVVNTSLESHPVHLLVHTVIFSSAVIMWFPVLNRIRTLPTMSPGGRMIYLFLQSVLPTVPAAFLTFGEGVLYRFYATVPRPFAMTAVEDQQFAGALMKVYAGLLLWGVIAVMFFRWYAADSRDKSADVLTWEEVERELARTPGPPG
ncbi:MAG: cytochrome c oxidase assembly protein [Acidimicrobiales bacterium]